MLLARVLLTDFVPMHTNDSAIGPIAIPAAGRSQRGHFTFAGDEGLEKYQWPYFAIHGSVSGPPSDHRRIHAAEYTHRGRSASDAARPRAVRGILIVIPLLTGPFPRAQRVRESEDGDNLNRLFPATQGKWGERFAHRLLPNRHALRVRDRPPRGDLSKTSRRRHYRETVEGASTSAFERSPTRTARYAVKSARQANAGIALRARRPNGVASMVAESGGRGLLIERTSQVRARRDEHLRAIGALDGAPTWMPRVW